ncbi:MAG TPA: J domain-containing protein [Aggregatilineales bacterium]|nr:J domain-containing protein [Aggregatilineales bacterium]
MGPEKIRIERLQAEIGLKRAALTEERAALQKLQSEIQAFARQYDRAVGPLEAELDAVRQQIEALQTTERNEPTSFWGPGYQSFEESFDAKYRRVPDPVMATPRRIDESVLRKLYRKLARKFHPDTTTDAAEKGRLTIIMAQINAAYRAKNIDELYAIDGQKGLSAKGKQPVIDYYWPQNPTWIELVKVAEKLDEEIASTRSEHSRLLSSPLMSLKIEVRIARSQGRDLLHELAMRIRADLDAARVELEQMRRH